MLWQKTFVDKEQNYMSNKQIFLFGSHYLALPRSRYSTLKPIEKWDEVFLLEEPSKAGQGGRLPQDLKLKGVF